VYVSTTVGPTDVTVRQYVAYIYSLRLSLIGWAKVQDCKLAGKRRIGPESSLFICSQE
jgi:hypothetical protein